jgi:hypothetical protein
MMMMLLLLLLLLLLLFVRSSKLFDSDDESLREGPLLSATISIAVGRFLFYFHRHLVGFVQAR